MSKQRAAVKTLLRLVTNVASHPDDPKYQQVRLENEYLARTLLGGTVAFASPTAADADTPFECCDAVLAPENVLAK